jgi:uncharacterized protein YicC (UPF0701 family)
MPTWRACQWSGHPRSKSVDQRTTQAAVETKVLIEQVREQVQNIE